MKSRKNFYDLIDGNNKIKFYSLVSYIIETKLSDFVAEVRDPFLMGDRLFEGSLITQQGGNNATAIFRGNQAGHAAGQQGDAINRAVYVLIPNANAFQEEDDADAEVFLTIGRSERNDITIVDYAVSKNHAKIYRKNGRFFIEDCGSTNGIEINNQMLMVQQKESLKSGCTVNFGRLRFRFVLPIDFYCRIRRLLEIDLPPKTELLKVFKGMPMKQLIRISRKHKISLPSKPTRVSILSTFYTELGDDLMIRELSASPMY